VLPGLIDGEKRNVSKYDDALRAISGQPVAALLTSQRGQIQQKIAQMELEQAEFDRTAAAH
jgi:hypothetical protein